MRIATAGVLFCLISGTAVAGYNPQPANGSQDCWTRSLNDPSAVKLTGKPAVASATRRPGVEPSRTRPSSSNPYYQQQTELIGLGSDAAWQSVPTNSPIVTAVIDTGVDGTHPDLQQSLVPGLDFTCGTGHCGNDTSDQASHGTNMTGIVVGGGNDVGTIGVAWNTSVMPMRITLVGEANDIQGAQAIDAAVAARVSVINASWGQPCPMPRVREAVLRAQQQGVLFVVAAGNGGYNVDDPEHAFYPAVYGGDNVLVVMGFDDQGNPDPASNWGKNTVDIAAPSTAYTTGRQRPGCLPAGCYDASGPATSVATAYVSGAAALLLSAHPQWPIQWVRTQLLESGDVSAAFLPKSKTGTRLRLDRALSGPIGITAPAAGASWSVGDTHSVRWTNSYSSSLCTEVSILISTDTVRDQVLLSGAANKGEASVRLTGLAPSERATLRLVCGPADFATNSGEFRITS